MLGSIFKNNSAPKTEPELVIALLEDGWILTGKATGTKTKVYTHPDKQDEDISAIRINNTPDIGFYHYAQLCLEHPSPHFQNISWHGFLEEDPYIHVTMTERLQPAPSVPAAAEPLKSKLRAFWNLANYFFPYANHDGIYDPNDEELMDTLIDRPDYNEGKIDTLMTQMGEQVPTLPAAFSLLMSAKIFLCSRNPRIPDMRPDLNPSNMMLREKDGNQTIVMADPFEYDIGNTEILNKGECFRLLKNRFGNLDESVLNTLKAPAPRW